MGQIFLGGNGGLLDKTSSAPDLEQLRQVERFVAYANSKGITIWLHSWWSRKGLNESVGPERLRRWWRYVIHRFGAWSAVLSGAAGHSYGGGHVWWAHVPEAPARQGAWPLEASFDVNTLDYPGAVSMGFLAQFLRANRWWELEPHPELVTDYPAPFCAAEPGRQYVIYARWGGGLKLDLRQTAESDEFRYTWIDLGKGTASKQGTVRGGAVREFQAPESYPSRPEVKDWLLHVVR